MAAQNNEDNTIFLNIGGSAEDFVEAVAQAASSVDNAASSIGDSFESISKASLLATQAMTQSLQSGLANLGSTLIDALKPDQVLNALQGIQAGIAKMSSVTAASAAATSGSLHSIANAAVEGAEKTKKAAKVSAEASADASKEANKNAGAAVASLGLMQATLEKLLKLDGTSIGIDLNTTEAQNKVEDFQERMSEFMNLAYAGSIGMDRNNLREKIRPLFDDLGVFFAERIDSIIGENTDNVSNALRMAAQKARRGKELSDEENKKGVEPAQRSQDFLDLSIVTNLQHIDKLLELRLRRQSESNKLERDREETEARILKLLIQQQDLENRSRVVPGYPTDKHAAATERIIAQLGRVGEANDSELKIINESLKSSEAIQKTSFAVVSSFEKGISLSAAQNKALAKTVDLYTRLQGLKEAEVALTEDQNTAVHAALPTEEEITAATAAQLKALKQKQDAAENILRALEEENRLLLDNSAAQAAANRLLLEYQRIKSSEARASEAKARQAALENPSSVASLTAETRLNTSEFRPAVPIASRMSTALSGLKEVDTSFSEASSVEDLRNAFLSAVKGGLTDSVKKAFVDASVAVSDELIKINATTASTATRTFRDRSTQIQDSLVSGFASERLRSKTLEKKFNQTVELPEAYVAPTETDLSALKAGQATTEEVTRLSRMLDLLKQANKEAAAKANLEKADAELLEKQASTMARIVEYESIMLSIARNMGKTLEEVNEGEETLAQNIQSLKSGISSATTVESASKNQTDVNARLGLAKLRVEAVRSIDRRRSEMSSIGATMSGEEYNSKISEVLSSPDHEGVQKIIDANKITPEIAELNKAIRALRAEYAIATRDAEKLKQENEDLTASVGRASTSVKQKMVGALETLSAAETEFSSSTELATFDLTALSKVSSLNDMAEFVAAINAARQANDKFRESVSATRDSLSSLNKEEMSDSRFRAAKVKYDLLKAQEDRYKRTTGAKHTYEENLSISEEMLKGVIEKTSSPGDIAEFERLISARRTSLQAARTSYAPDKVVKEEPSTDSDGKEKAKQEKADAVAASRDAAMREQISRRFDNIRLGVDKIIGSIGEGYGQDKVQSRLKEVDSFYAGVLDSVKSANHEELKIISERLVKEERLQKRRNAAAGELNKVRATLAKHGFEMEEQEYLNHLDFIVNATTVESLNAHEREILLSSSHKKTLAALRDFNKEVKRIEKTKQQTDKALTRVDSAEERATLESQRPQAPAALEFTASSVLRPDAALSLAAKKKEWAEYEAAQLAFIAKIEGIVDTHLKAEEEAERKHATNLLRIERESSAVSFKLARKKLKDNEDLSKELRRVVTDYQMSPIITGKLVTGEVLDDGEIEEARRILTERSKKINLILKAAKLSDADKKEVEEKEKENLDKQRLAADKERTRYSAETLGRRMRVAALPLADAQSTLDSSGSYQKITSLEGEAKNAQSKAALESVKLEIQKEKDLLLLREQAIKLSAKHAEMANAEKQAVEYALRSIITATTADVLSAKIDETKKKINELEALKKEADKNARLRTATSRMDEEGSRVSTVLYNTAREASSFLSPSRSQEDKRALSAIQDTLNKAASLREAARKSGRVEDAENAQATLREDLRLHRSRLSLLRDYLSAHKEATRAGIKTNRDDVRAQIREILSAEEQGFSQIQARIRDIVEHTGDVKSTKSFITKYVEDMQSAANRIQSLGRGMINTAQVIGSAITGALVSTAHYFENIRVMADETSVSLEEAQRMLGMFMQYGVSASRAEQAIKMLSRLYTDALERGGAALQKFNDMGISMGALASTGGDVYRVFDLVTQKLEKIEDPLKKAAAATALVGRSNTMVIPVLTASNKALEEARKNTVVMGRSASEAVLRISASFEQFQITMKMITASILVFAEGPLRSFMASAATAAKALMGLADNWKGLISTLVGAAAVIGTILAALGTLITTIGALAAAVGSVAMFFMNFKAVILGFATAFGVVSAPVAGLTALVIGLAGAMGYMAVASAQSTEQLQRDMEKAHLYAEKLERDRRNRGKDQAEIGKYVPDYKPSMTTLEKKTAREQIDKDVAEADNTIQSLIEEQEKIKKKGIPGVGKDGVDARVKELETQITQVKKKRVELYEALKKLNLIDPTDSPEALAAAGENQNFMNKKSWDEQYQKSVVDMRNSIKKADAMTKESIDAWRENQLRNLEGAQIRNEDVQNMQTRVAAQYSTLLTSASSANAAAVKTIMRNSKKDIERMYREHQDFSEDYAELKPLGAEAITSAIGDRYITEVEQSRIKREAEDARKDIVSKIMKRKMDADIRDLKNRLVIDLETKVGHTRIDDVTGEYLRQQSLVDMTERFRKEKTSYIDNSQLTSAERKEAKSRLEEEIIKMRKSFSGREIALEAETVKAVKAIREAHANEEKARMDFALEQKKSETRTRFQQEEINLVNQITKGKMSQGNVEREMFLLSQKKHEAEMSYAREEEEIRRKSYETQKIINLKAIQDLEKSVEYYQKLYNDSASDGKTAEKARRGWENAFSALSEARTSYVTAERNEWKAHNESIARIAMEGTKKIQEDYAHKRKIMEEYAAARKRLNGMEVSWSENAVSKAEETAEAQIEAFQEAGRAALEKALQIENAAEMEKEVNATLRRLTQDETQLRISLLKNLRQAFQAEFSQLFDFLKDVGGLTTNMMKDMLDSIDKEIADMVRAEGADALVSQQFNTLRATQKKIFDEMQKNKGDEMSFGQIYDAQGKRVESVGGFGSFMGGLTSSSDPYAEHMKKVLGSSAISNAGKYTKDLVSQFTGSTSIVSPMDTLKTKFYDMSSIVERLNSTLAKTISNFHEWGTVTVPKKSKYMTATPTGTPRPEDVDETRLSKDIHSRYNTDMRGGAGKADPSSDVVAPRRYADPPIPAHTPIHKARPDTVNNLHSTVIINGASVSGVAKKIMEDSVAVLNSKVISATNNGLSSFSV